MDKLKPILAHKFWIFFAIALLLPTFGWWTASGSLQEQFNSRKTALDGVFGQIPNGRGTPNQPWIDGVAALSQKRDQSNQTSHQNLWDKQLELLVWPESIAEVMSRCPYRGKITEGDDMDSALDVPDLYRGDYEAEIEKLWQVIEPLGNFDGEQKVELKPELVPRVPQAKWSELPPSWEELWDAQEDIWLLTEIFQAIQEVNGKTANRADSYIKRIQRIELAGGNRESISGGAVAAKPAAGRLLARIGGGTQASQKLSGDFQLFEEFGNPAARVPQQSPAAAGDKPAEGETANVVQKTANPRYVDDGPKFRTRAFYLKLDMDHRRVPHLLVALTNSKWPVEIVRVNQIARSENANSGNDEEEDSGDKLEISESALTGPNMSTVIIAGLMTLYNPPVTATAEGQPTEQASPAADGSAQPTEGQPTDEATSPTEAPAVDDTGTATPANN